MRQTNESKLGIEFIADLITDCEQSDISCIVDDRNNNVLIYDINNGMYTDYDNALKHDVSINEVLMNSDIYDEVMLPAVGEEFKKFAIEWNSLYRKSDDDEVYKTNNCHLIHGKF